MIVLCTIISSWAAASDLASNCFGKKDAKKHLVYLHGFDPKGFSNEEKLNRRILKELAETKGYLVALPRSAIICKKNQKYCWQYGGSEQTKQTFDKIDNQVGACGVDHRKATWIGFSQGGYMLNHLFLNCYDWFQGSRKFVVAGAASKVAAKGPALTKCGAIAILAGKHEGIKHRGKKMAQVLADSRQVKATYHEHPGHHHLPKSEVLDGILTKLSSP